MLNLGTFFPLNLQLQRSVAFDHHPTRRRKFNCLPVLLVHLTPAGHHHHHCLRSRKVVLHAQRSVKRISHQPGRYQSHQNLPVKRSLTRSLLPGVKLEAERRDRVLVAGILLLKYLIAFYNYIISLFIHLDQMLC